MLPDMYYSCTISTIPVCSIQPVFHSVDRTSTGDIAVGQTTKLTLHDPGPLCTGPVQSQLFIGACGVYNMRTAQYVRPKLFGDVDFTLGCSPAPLGIPGTTSIFRSVYQWINRRVLSISAACIDACMLYY